jgi:transposase InsO family protein
MQPSTVRTSGPLCLGALLRTEGLYSSHLVTWRRLGVVKTHSRPYVSNDNPFSEAQFRTLKYCPHFPDRFGSIDNGRVFGHAFFRWYNQEHRQSGLGFLTPAVVHFGLADVVCGSS